jgi:hypothetical protein
MTLLAAAVRSSDPGSFDRPSSAMDDGYQTADWLLLIRATE